MTRPIHRHLSPTPFTTESVKTPHNGSRTPDATAPRYMAPALAMCEDRESSRALPSSAPLRLCESEIRQPERRNLLGIVVAPESFDQVT